MGSRKKGTRYEATVFVDRAAVKFAEQALDDCNVMCEDEVKTFTASFPDGKVVDVKLVGSQNGPAWTEAVIFEREHGSPFLRCRGFTEVSDSLLGPWHLECDGVEYVVNMKEKD